MKHITILLLILNVSFLKGQKATFRIYPLDYCSEVKYEYSSLFNNNHYFIDYQNEFDLFRIETDTNFIKLNGDTLIVGNRTGETYLRAINLKSKSVIYSQRIRILNRPIINIETDTSELRTKGIISFHLGKEIGDKLIGELKLVHMTRNYFDKNNTYLFSHPSSSQENTLEIDLKNHPEIAIVRIETLYRHIENGLCIKAEEKIVKILNGH